MTDEDIQKLAVEIAHQNTPACKNRPAFMQDYGHGSACRNLAKIIAAAMREARDKK